MAERKIDALVMQHNNDWLGGYVRWFTDTNLSNGYPRTRHLPGRRSDDRDRHGAVRRPPQSRRRGRDQPRRRRHDLHAGFHLVAYTDDYQAELTVTELKRRGYRTVGWLGSGAMPHKFVARVERELAGSVTFVDATEFVDLIKAIKSEEEMQLIRLAAEMQDEIFARVCRKIRPGMRDNDITALAQYEGRLLGSEQGLVSRLVGAARAGLAVHRSPHAGPRAARRRAFQHPDREQRTRRHVYRDRPHHGARQGLERADRRLRIDEGGADAHLAAAQAGHVLRRRRGKARRLHARAGLPPELRLYAHGQGYDLVERPLIRADETMTIEETMNLAVHPGYETPSIFAVICDNYLIGPDGPGECLHKTPKQVFEL